MTSHFNGDDDDSDPEPDLEPWVRIQQNTFTNWMNDKLRKRNLEIENMRTELKDGIKLCRLMEELQGKKLRGVIEKKKKEKSTDCGNIALALETMQKDGVKLVNIGAQDIASGNMKLILGLMWTLIRRYQIGVDSQSRLPPKKLMLEWINAVLYPHMRVGNFTRDWNDGIALHGLVDYCKPGSCPEWHNMNKSDTLSNCENVMQLADDLFQIPMVVTPENMSSPMLDELSCMTYISYFMAEGAPGYMATLNWVKEKISPERVDNFDRDWNNGFVLSALVHSLGAPVAGWPNMESLEWPDACQRAMSVSENNFDVPKLIAAKDMCNPSVDHIGVMAYAAWHQAKANETQPTPAPPIFFPPPPPVEEPEPVRERTPTPPPPSPPPSPPYVVEVIPPPPPVQPIVQVTPEPPTTTDVKVHLVPNWRVYAANTIKVETGGDTEADVRSVAHPPSGAPRDLPVAKVAKDVHHITFHPDIKGLWFLDVLIRGEHVHGSPFNMNVYDASHARIVKSTTSAQVDRTYTFEVDCVQVGVSEVDACVLTDGETVENTVTSCGVERSRVGFTPRQEATHVVNVYVGGVEASGSPFDVIAQKLDRIFAYGEGLQKAFKGRDSEFEVDASSLPGKELKVFVYAPSGRDYNAETKIQPNGHINVKYCSEEIGLHRMEVLYDHLPVPGSPFSVDVKQPTLYVRDFKMQAMVGHHTQFVIDASEMGKGTLEIDSDIPVLSYDKIGNRVYLVTMVPKQIGKHDVVIKYGDQIMADSPYEVTVE